MQAAAGALSGVFRRLTGAELDDGRPRASRRAREAIVQSDSEGTGGEARIDPARPLQRGIIILPSAFTLGNLFFGVYAIVAATRGDFDWAGWFIVLAGVMDLLDGRVARFTARAPRSAPSWTRSSTRSRSEWPRR